MICRLEVSSLALSGVSRRQFLLRRHFVVRTYSCVFLLAVCSCGRSEYRLRYSLPYHSSCAYPFNVLLAQFTDMFLIIHVLEAYSDSQLTSQCLRLTSYFSVILEQPYEDAALVSRLLLFFFCRIRLVLGTVFFSFLLFFTIFLIFLDFDQGFSFEPFIRYLLCLLPLSFVSYFIFFVKLMSLKSSRFLSLAFLPAYSIERCIAKVVVHHDVWHFVALPDYG